MKKITIIVALILLVGGVGFVWLKFLNDFSESPIAEDADEVQNETSAKRVLLSEGDGI